MADHVTNAQPHATQATSSAGHLLGRPPPRPTWVLRVPTLVSSFLLALFLLLMPLSLHRTIVPRPCLVPDRRPHICGPVPHSRRKPLSLHAGSHRSSLTVRPCVLMSYKAQQL